MGWFFRTVLIMILPVLTAVYTVNFGRWMGKKKYQRGAAGVYALALLTVAVPLAVLFFLRD